MKSRLVQTLCRVLAALIGLHGASAALAAPGDLDGTYGQHGRALFDVPGASLSLASSFFQQADGKTVAVGFARASSVAPADFLIVRFNADGSLDTTFGAGRGTPGYVRQDFDGVAANDSAAAGVQQADGKLVIVGSRTIGPAAQRQMAVLRLNADGSLDTTFDGDGKASPAVGTDAVAVDVHLQNDGAIVLAGFAVAGAANDFAFVRLTTTGAVDTTYGTGGSTLVHFGGSEILTRAIRQADGKVVAVGLAAVGAARFRVAARVNVDGTLDTTFNGSGQLVSAACIGLCQWSGVTQQSDGKLLFAGFGQLPATADAPELSQDQSIVARYSTNGSIDTSFATNGELLGYFARGGTLAGDRATATAVDPVSGAITILGGTVGRVYNTTGAMGLGGISVVVGRVLGNGVIDASFGQEGMTGVPFSSPLHAFNDTNPSTLVRLSDGRLLVSCLPGQYVNGSPIAQSVTIARTTVVGGDPGVITVTAANPVAETIGNTVLRILRSGGTAGAVSVAYTTVQGSAAGLDFTTTSGTVTWADGDNAVKFVSVPIINDGLVEGADESFSFVLSGATGGAAIDVSTVMVTIVRDDVPPGSLLTLSQSAITVAEGVGTVSVTVARTGTAAVSTYYYVAAVSANLTNDFTRSSGVLGWAVGDTSTRTITVPIVNDTINEGTEAFNIVLTGGSGAGVAFGSHVTVVTITDNDPLQVGLSSATAAANESQASITLNVVRTGVTTQAMSVNYATANGTATSGADFTATNGTLTWLPTDTDTKTITIPLTGDTTFEGDETFTVTLSNSTGGATLGTPSATITIIEDDLPTVPPYGNDVLSGGGKKSGGSMGTSWMLILTSLLLMRWAIRRRSSRR